MTETGGTEYVICLIGKVIAKKNLKRTFRGKDGKMAVTYGAGQDALDRLSMQIPGEVRDLGLLHPDIEFFFTVPDGRIDTDNSITTLMDILVKMGVLQDDSVAKNNGTKTIHPARRGDVATTIIKLTDRGLNQWPEKVKKRVRPQLKSTTDATAA